LEGLLGGVIGTAVGPLTASLGVGNWGVFGRKILGKWPRLL